MSIAGAAFGASQSLEQILAEQMLKAKMAQQQQMEAARLQMDQQRMGMERERLDHSISQDKSKQREGQAAGLVGAMDDQFDPASTHMDPEISPDVMAQLQGTTQAPRVREISTLSARGVTPELAKSVDPTPKPTGIHRLTPTGEQQGERRTIEGMRRVREQLRGAKTQDERRGVAGDAFGDGIKVPDSLTGPTAEEEAKLRETLRGERMDDFRTQEGIRAAHRPPTGGSPEDVQDTARQLVSGNLVPSMLSRRGNYNQVLAEANRVSMATTGKPYNAARAQTEFGAATRFAASMNSPQQTRFRGLGVAVVNTIDEVKSLSEELANSGVPLANKARLAAYVQTMGNTPQGQLAARYIGAVNTLKEEFANLANGGYAPTESAWELANAQINGDFGVKQMEASLTEVQRLINFRLNAFDQISPIGVRSDNPVLGEPTPRVETGSSGGGGAKRKVYDINGNLVVEKKP